MKRKDRVKRDEPPERRLCPELPPIPESVINWKGVEWRKDEDDIRNRYHWYAGPIEPGMIFAWEPDLPHARQLLIVCCLGEPLAPLVVKHPAGVAYLSRGSEQQVWTRTLDSPSRGKPFVAPSEIEIMRLRQEYPNNIDRFREAVVPTIMARQIP